MSAAAEPQIVDFLASTPLLRGIERELLQEIASVTTVRKFPRGTLVLRQGEDVPELYIVASGEVQVLVEDRELEVSWPIVNLGPGETFGEMSLLTGDAGLVTVKAVADTYCIALARSDFQDVLTAIPEVAVSISRYLARRLAADNRDQGFQFVRLGEHRFDAEAYSLVPREVLERHQIVPLAQQGETLVFATPHPKDPSVYRALKACVPGLSLKPVACGEDDYLDFLQRVVYAALGPFRRPGQEAPDVADYRGEEVAHIQVEGRFSTETEINPEIMATVADQILAEAVNRQATEIHLEQRPERVIIRLRVDGQLSPLKHEIQPRFFRNLARRYKGLAGIDARERWKPQEGRMAFRLRDRTFDVRLSTIPTRFGEKLTLGLQEPDRSVVRLSRSVSHKTVASMLRDAVLSRGGAVLVAGPSGSGRTTTVYSALKECLEEMPEINVLSVEGPIEYTLEGITQVQAAHEEGMGMAELARAALRHSPDVLMVSELRDEPTARVALQTALTGCTVLSTIQSEGAVETVLRLLELGCATYLVASALELVVAQRLLRQICPRCTVVSPPSPLVRSNLDRLGILPQAESAELAQGTGCSSCSGTGYHGRVAAFEALRMEEVIQEALLRSPRVGELRKLATEHGAMTNFKSYCAFLLKSGATSGPEVLRMFAGISAGSG